MIEVQALSKVFGSTRAVDNLSFRVEPGAVTGFLGPNGAGKSTTMRMIVGLDRPTSGSARIKGHAYQDLSDPLRTVGTLLDARAVNPGFSAFRHLRWIADTHHFPARRVEEVLDQVGLSNVAGSRIGGFSLGMSQRLGLAAALLGDPEVLILDEPINGLDPEGIHWVRTLVRGLAAEGRTVFISSHLLSEMAHTADRVVVIGRGQLVADTSMSEFLAQHSTVRTRVRSCDNERLGVELRRAGLSVHDVGEALEIDDATPEEVGKLAFDAAIAIYELSAQTASLEQAYLDTTHEAVQFSAKEQR